MIYWALSLDFHSTIGPFTKFWAFINPLGKDRAIMLGLHIDWADAWALRPFFNVAGFLSPIGPNVGPIVTYWALRLGLQSTIGPSG